MTELARRIHAALAEDLSLCWLGELSRVFDRDRYLAVRQAVADLHEMGFLHYDPSTGAISNVTPPPEPAA